MACFDFGNYNFVGLLFVSYFLGQVLCCYFALVGYSGVVVLGSYYSERSGLLGEICLCRFRTWFVKIYSFSNKSSTLFMWLNIATYFGCLCISVDASDNDVIIISCVIDSFVIHVSFLLLLLLLTSWFVPYVWGEKFSSEMNGFWSAKNFKNSVSYFSVHFTLLFSHLSVDRISSLTHSSLHNFFIISFLCPLSFFSIISSISLSILL